MNHSKFHKFYSLLDDKKTKKRIEDKWILSKVNSLINDVTKGLESYSIDKPFNAIMNFVVRDLSRSYIKMTRDRNDTKQILKEIILSLLEPLGEVNIHTRV